MVKIIATHLRKSEQGNYISLELQGDLEMIQSQNTGRFYATARRCFVSSTFTEEVAKGFIGKELPGEIVRVQSEPYEFQIPETGEVITLTHSYLYIPVNQKVQSEQPVLMV